MIGIDPESEGLAPRPQAGSGDQRRRGGLAVGAEREADFIFEATSAYVHKAYAPRYEEAGIRAIDLTPAAVGPGVIRRPTCGRT